MTNRYSGNTGRVVHIEDAPLPQREHIPGTPSLRQSERRSVQDIPPPAPAKAAPPQRSKPRQPLAGILPESLAELETEDIILLLILYLMYRESGDSELLIIMGAMFLL